LEQRTPKGPSQQRPKVSAKSPFSCFVSFQVYFHRTSAITDTHERLAHNLRKQNV